MTKLRRRLGVDGGNRSELFLYGFHGYAFSQPVVAVGVWLALTLLGLFREKSKLQTPARSTPRNGAVSMRQRPKV